MRHKDTQNIKDVVSEYLKKSGLERGLKESKVTGLWSDVLGQTIVSYTQEIKFQNGWLKVKISSSVVRHELFMMRDSIIDEMNKRLGSKVVYGIVLS